MSLRWFAGAALILVVAAAACATPAPSSTAEVPSSSLAASVAGAGAASPSSAASAAGPASASPEPGSPGAAGGATVLGAMLRAVTDTSPVWVRLDLEPDELDGDWRLDGTADDGAGQGRLFVDVTARPGNLEASPCLDPDFRQGGACTVRVLPDGGLLALRGIVRSNGTSTIDVALIHPDRTGVVAEASNFSLDPRGGPVPGGTPRGVLVNRGDPVYTLEQLVALVVAVDRAVSACLAAGCR